MSNQRSFKKDPDNPFSLKDIKTFSIRNQLRTTILDFLINNTGYTRFHYSYILCVVFILSLEGIHLPLMSTLSLPIREYYKMSTFSFELISAIIFIGIAVGSGLMIYLSDKLGRIVTLNIALIELVIFHFIMVFSTTQEVFGFSRFMIGIGLGIVTPISLNIVIEVLPTNNRASILTCLWLGSGIGTALIYIGLFILMPQYQYTELKPLFIILWLLHVLVAFITMFFFKDSPRSMILRGHSTQGINLLEKMCHQKLALDTKLEIIKQTRAGLNLENKVKKLSLKSLFSKKYLSITLPLGGLWMLLSIVTYGPMIITPQTVNILNLFENNNTGLMITQLVTAIAMLVGTIVGAFSSENKKLGRRVTMLIGWSFATFFSLFLFLVPASFPGIIAIVGFLLCIGSNLSVTYTSELFPTKIRDAASGFFFLITRIGGFVSQFIFVQLVYVNVLLPYYLLTFLFLCMSFLTMLLPIESQGKALDIDLESESIWNRLFPKREF